MQRQHLGIISILVTLTGVVGCVPATFVQVPAIRGRVVGVTGEPIANATIHVTRESNQSEVATVPTAADGTFSKAEQGSFFFQFAGADAAVDSYTVSATADGHRSPTTQVTGGVRRFYDPSTDRDLGTFTIR